jgi:LEA14-like dessication related protein
MRTFIFILISFVLFTGCATFQEPEFRGSEGVKMEKMDGQEISLSAGVKVYNPNWFALKIKPSTVEVYLEEQLMGTVKLTKKVKVKAKQESSLSLPLLATLEDGAMFTALRYAKKDQVKVRIKGKVKGGIFFLSKKVEVDETQTVSGKDLNLGNK